MTLIFDKPLILGKKEVYNPEVFTIAGSPTITSDGIASGFDSSNYITSFLTFTPTSQVRYTAKFTTDNLSTTQMVFRFYNNLTGSFITNAVYIAQNKLRFQYTDRNFVVTDIEENKTYWVILEWLDGKYYFKISTDSINYTDIAEPIESTEVMQGNNSRFTIGYSTNNGVNLSAFFLGEIDLKELSVIVDGSEVLSGTKLIVPEWQNKPFKFDGVLNI